ETFLCGDGLTRDYAAASGEMVTAETIVTRGEREDPAAKRVLARYTERLARATTTLINVIDPHVIVLGGGLSNIAALYEEVPKLWQGMVFSDTVATLLKPPAHGDASGVRGAAWLGT